MGLISHSYFLFTLPLLMDIQTVTKITVILSGAAENIFVLISCDLGQAFLSDKLLQVGVLG